MMEKTTIELPKESLMFQVSTVLLLHPLVGHSPVQELLWDGNFPGEVNILRHPRQWSESGLAETHPLK